MFKASYKIATIFGIPIKLHISVIVLFFMQMTNEFLGFYYGLLMGLGLLVSISLHELGHSLVAIAKKCRVREITLMFMGGVAQMESIPRKPMDEFLMAIAGPLVSLSLGAGLFTIGKMVPMPPIPKIGWNYFMVLGLVNAGLGVFNLIPAFPMDGGRILRAALTPFIGRLRATGIAARIGKAAAWGFGIWGLFRFDPLLIAVAFFIHFAASSEYRMVLIQERGRPFGFWDWMRAASGQKPPVNEMEDDEVIISPPPYKRGPSSRSKLSEDQHAPFDNMHL